MTRRPRSAVVVVVLCAALLGAAAPPDGYTPPTPTPTPRTMDHRPPVATDCGSA